MRAGPNPIPTVLIQAALLLPAVILLAGVPAEARPQSGRAARATSEGAGSDLDRTLARRAARDRLETGGIWRARSSGPAPGPEQTWRPPGASPVPPATRERVAAPPFTGWGYGGTIPGAGPGF